MEIREIHAENIEFGNTHTHTHTHTHIGVYSINLPVTIASEVAPPSVKLRAPPRLSDGATRKIFIWRFQSTCQRNLVARKDPMAV